MKDARPSSQLSESQAPSRSFCSSESRSSSSSSRASASMAYRIIPSLARPLPLAEHRADLGAAVAAVPRPEARISRVRRLRRTLARIEDSWVGDLVGVSCLAVTGYLLFALAGVLS